MNQRSKWNTKNIQLLEENIQGNLYDFGFGNGV